jgi:membrane protein involved in colicin uptake
MLSTQYRLKLEGICQKIATQEEVSLEEIIWAEKLAKANQTAARFLRQARRKAENPDMREGDLDDFLNQLDIGGLGHERGGIKGFNSPDEIAEWFSRDRDSDDEENRRRRD